MVEQLEERALLSNYTAGTVRQLIADIHAANRHGGSNTITLVAGKTFDLTAVNNKINGANGLPVIAKNDQITIVGNGDTIERSTASGTPAFRLFDVAAGASLTLTKLTVQGGLAYGSGVAAEGGGIFNQGSLVLNNVTVQNNTASGQNGAGQPAAGGGMFSSGSLTLEGGTVIQNNEAHGGQGAQGGVSGSRLIPGGPGGNGFGGGLYVASGTATLTDVSVASNTALGGPGGVGRPHGHPGLGEGGGLYINTAATVSLDASTVANVINNNASTSDPNIHGTYSTK
jgi:hypothetical protein